jgi:predicted dehydrogenase
MDKKDTIGVVIVGYGYWSPNLIRNIRKFSQFKIIAICEKNLARHEKIQQDYPDLKIYQHYRDAFADPEVHAAVIGTIISSHFRIAKMALEYKKHILIEKPMTVTVAESKILLKIAKKNDVRIMIDHTYVYSPAIVKLKNIIQEGGLGSVYAFDSIRVNLGLIQRDANVVLDLAPHDFSILLYLINEKPHYVSAVGAVPIVHTAQEKPQEDIAYITVGFKSGLLAHIHVSWLAPIKTRRITILGKKKMAVYDQLDTTGSLKIFNHSVELLENKEPGTPLFKYKTEDIEIPEISKGSEDLEIMIKNFLDLIVYNIKPPTDGEFGIDVVRLLAATQKSLQKGGKRIKI